MAPPFATIDLGHRRVRKTTFPRSRRGSLHDHDQGHAKRQWTRKIHTRRLTALNGMILAGSVVCDQWRPEGVGCWEPPSLAVRCNTAKAASVATLNPRVMTRSSR